MRARGAARPALLAPIAVLLAAALAFVLAAPAPRGAPGPGEGDEARAARRALETAEELRLLPPGSPLLRVPAGSPSATYTGEAAGVRAAHPSLEPPLLPEWTVELLRFDASAGRFVVVPGGSAHEVLRIAVRVRRAPEPARASRALDVRPVLSRLTFHRLAPSPGGGGP